ncbi:outer membrane beta-barrel protein [Maribacter sp. PR1]|uniref:Outer membrane beta-barrel protein n=1 Tax=Maribacter cobaltidurans TaxID=1178778 RepID=A0ABU7IZ02_9FLAO|nr:MULTISPECIES: outer membrane beta-barrel protein [Maribacter]MDC6390840.1 outer membrane beta-barrel protein [Maribacter sp. PR1]MEE1978232.1 outer membrane beta-barrel protein [Maribacter cobaltidurans]
MKQLFITSAFVLLSLLSYSQDQKWSVEANYPIQLIKDRSDPKLAFDTSLKYRFLNTDLVHLGLDFNIGFERYKPGVNNDDTFKFTNYILQPKVFAEFDLPFVPKLHPVVGLGYSVFFYEQSGSISGVQLNSDNNSDGGFNLELGVTYDISKRFFIQAKYDYIRLHNKGVSTIDGESFSYNFTDNIDRLKVGVGLRF